MYKLIIFDVDGTLYDLNDVVEANYNMQVDFYAQHKQLTYDEVRKIFSDNSILPYKSEKARSATEFFLKNGIDSHTWESYRNIHTSPSHIHIETAASNSLLTMYSTLTRLVLLSSNTEENIQKTLSRINIDNALFDAVFSSSSDFGPKPFNKSEMIKYILQTYDLIPSEVLSIGDRYETDIAPLISMGGDGALLKTPQSLKEIYSDLVNGTLETSETGLYKFYNGINYIK